MQTALITGASAGIGKELAIQFAKKGINLVLVARRAEVLQQIAAEIISKYAVQVQCFECDLIDLSNLQKLVDSLVQTKVVINYLVNNAGVGKSGAFDAMDWNDSSDMIQLNMTAVTYLTKRFVDDLGSKTDAKILNVASTAAFQPVPNLAVYSATKAFLLSFTDALSVELKSKKISVTTLCPSDTNTGFLDSSGLRKIARISKSNLATPSLVAEFGMNNLMQNKRLAVFGLKNRLLLFGQRFVSRTTILKIASNLYT